MKTVSKRFLILMLILLIIFACCGLSATAQTYDRRPVLSFMEEEEEFKIEKIYEFSDSNLEYYTEEELIQLIEKYQKIQDDAHTLAETARTLGWPEDSEAIQSAQAEWFNAQLAIELYQEQYEKLFNSIWSVRAREYPVATEIWLYMKDCGWNDYVCAGILGNMMAEVGGGTLNLRWDAYGQGFYGLCQWSKSRGSNVWGANVETQCSFLKNTIKSEMDTFGYAFAQGFDYEDFLNLVDERDAAIAFSKCYERNDSTYTAIRADYAETAYNYFAGK